MPSALTKDLRSAMIRDLMSVTESERRRDQKKFYNMFPDEDTIQPDGSILYAREKYPKHLEFFEAGAKYRERAAICANRIGKSYGMGGYEITCHLTGDYPPWWTGRRFKTPIKAWAAGKNNETTRDTIQTILCGEVVSGNPKGITGTGMIPGDRIGEMTWKQGAPNLLDTLKVKSAFGGWSTLGLKSYERGRGSFEGTAQHVIWGDEEMPFDIYGECVMRTATTGGIIMLTFTPLEGLTEVVLQFMPEDMRPGGDDL